MVAGMGKGVAMGLGTIAILGAAALGAATVGAGTATAQDDLVKRGEYLVSIIGCTDCHTDGALIGQPNMERYLGGSSIGFGSPAGVFYGPNLTSDPTGLGDWTDEQIDQAMRQGVRPDGRILSPIMPYHNFAHMTDDDAVAVVAYLRTLPHVSYDAPGPFGPGETPTSPYLNLVVPQQ